MATVPIDDADHGPPGPDPGADQDHCAHQAEQGATSRPSTRDEADECLPPQLAPKSPSAACRRQLPAQPGRAGESVDTDEVGRDPGFIAGDLGRVGEEEEGACRQRRVEEVHPGAAEDLFADQHAEDARPEATCQRGMVGGSVRGSRKPVTKKPSLISCPRTHAKITSTVTARGEGHGDSGRKYSAPWKKQDQKSVVKP